MGLLNNWDVHLGSTFAHLTPSYCDRCTRGGPLLRQSRSMYPWGGFNTDSRNPISGGMWANFNFGDEGHTEGTSLSPYVSFRLSTRLQAQIGTNVFWGHDNTQWFGNFTDSIGATHYTFAHLEQTTRSATIRLNYTFAPNVSLQVYAQPFISAGTYGSYREVVSPRAAHFADRFSPLAATPDANGDWPAGALAWSNWREAGASTENEGWGVGPRSRLMSVLGMLVSAMFFLVILAQWIASWVFGPCQW